MKNVFAKLISLILVIGLLIGCAPAPQPALTEAPASAPTEAPATAVPTPELEHLKVSVLPFISFLPFFIAQEEGYFAAQNLEVEFVNIQTTPENTTALLSGQIDVMTGFASAGLLNAMSQDVKVQIVADKGYLDPQGCTAAGLLARKDIVTNGELNLSGDEIKNSKTNYVKGTIAEYFFDTSIASLGVNSGDVKDITIPYNELAAAFKTGSMDIANASEPWVTRVLSGGDAVVWKDYKTIFPNAEFSMIVFGPTLLENNSDAGNRFMIAYLQAVKQYQEGKTDRNIEIASTYTKLDPAELKTLCWLSIHEDGAINTQTIVDFQDWAVAKGYMQNALPVDVFWNSSFVQYAQNALK